MSRFSKIVIFTFSFKCLIDKGEIFQESIYTQIKVLSIEGDNKKSVSSAGIINFIYNETIVSRALPSSSVDYN